MRLLRPLLQSPSFTVPVIAGLAVGFLAAAWLRSLLSTLLFGIAGVDPWMFGASAVLLLGIGAAASIPPALRAAAVDPATALRAE